jgi:sugar lactone lactonase YvrE
VNRTQGNQGKWLSIVLTALAAGLFGATHDVARAATPKTQTPKLFTLLPDYCATPDGMAIDAEGNLIVACPNFADQTRPGCLVKISVDHKVTKWVDVPVLAATGLACPMGIEFGLDGDLYVCDNQGWKGTKEGAFKGRVLRLRIRDNHVAKTTVVAEGMEHPNGVRVRGGYLYVTESMMTKVKDPSGLVVSAVYRFKADDQGIRVTNTLRDKNIITTFLTQNRACQYGADGIAFDKAGNLYVGNFGDGAVHKITFDAKGNVSANKVWAKDPKQLQTTDGLCFDAKGNLYVADFSANAVAVVTPDAKIRRIAQSPDSDGQHGELDQPGEPIIFDGKLVLSCFDLVTGPDKVNTKHDMPAKMSMLEAE